MEVVIIATATTGFVHNVFKPLTVLGLIRFESEYRVMSDFIICVSVLLREQVQN